MKVNQVEYTLVKARALKKAYHNAVEQRLEWFTFEGQEYVTNYAKYLLEYLATKLGSI